MCFKSVHLNKGRKSHRESLHSLSLLLVYNAPSNSNRRGLLIGGAGE
jgi:hypothetical protein